MILIVGNELMVRLKVSGIPVQPPRDGMTIILPVVSTGKLAAVNAILPVPLAPSPIVVLLFVQEKVAPEVPVKDNITVVSAQKLVSGIGFTTGDPMTEILKF